MNKALQSWREEFNRSPGAAFDRLVRGLVPLGTRSMLSLGEILDDLFEPGNEELDRAASDWLEQHILAAIPPGTALHRWTAILEEFFRAIALMELPATNELLRTRYKRLRLWLTGFYEGPDRDPEGAYLLALARAQSDQRFSALWRRLILGEELASRPYVGIGLLGFRKMPDADGREAADVPEGLLQAVVELAEKPGTTQAKWKQIVRSLFAAYRRSESYWTGRLAPILPHYQQQSNSRDWLTSLLPRIQHWRPAQEGGSPAGHRASPVRVSVSQEWAQRVRNEPELVETPEFSAFLNQHRAYAQVTGDPEYINKTFNYLSMSLIRGGSDRASLAVSLIEEALEWAPSNPHNWTSYAIVLSAADRIPDAINALWEARQRFPWDPFIRSELGRLLRQHGELDASEGVLREAVSHFPTNVVCWTLLAETLIDQGDVTEAERVYGRALAIDPSNAYARGGVARALSIRSARDRDEALRDRARHILEELAAEGNHDAINRLRVFDREWEAATTDATVAFRREVASADQQSHPAPDVRPVEQMSHAERLGRAMIALWKAERSENSAEKASLLDRLRELLAIPDDQVNEDLLAAFVETRGLLLLAAGDAREALAFFKSQIRDYGRGGWIGIRLGETRARAILADPETTDQGLEEPTSESARFALHVAKVIQALASSPREDEVRSMLKSLYPRAAEFAARAQVDRQRGDAANGGAEMAGTFLQSQWFAPAGVESADDLDQPERLATVLSFVHATKIETFDVLSNAARAAAA
jgi:tetratricopeptide (TPR) repeat protein